MLFKCILCCVLFHEVLLLPEVIRVGGIFEAGDADKLEKAFKEAIKRFNIDHKLPDTTLISEIRRVPKSNSFEAIKQVCKMLNRGVAAVFGPHTNDLSQAVGSVLDSFDVPHFEARWDGRRRNKDYTFNMFPEWQTVVQAYKDVLKAKEWKKYAILYEDNEALIRIQWLLQSSSSRINKNIMRLRKLTNPYRDTLREIKLLGIDNILLDCKTENIQRILKQAQQVGLMNDHNSFIITNLDLHTVNMDDFMHSQTNITGFRIIDPESEKVQSVLANFREYREQRIRRRKPIIDTYTALIVDAVATFADAIKRSDGIKEISFNPINCDSGGSWSTGSLYNELQMTNLTGLTGLINFDHRGLRSNIELDIIEVTSYGLLKAGSWSSTRGLRFHRQEKMTYDEAARSLWNKTLVVTTLLNQPYIMVKESSTELTGNARYEGYCIDLLEAIAKKLKFKYKIHINEEKKPGKKDNKTGQWNGMIGELLRGEADLAVGDLTITFEREEAVDFTMPFMNLGISILFKKPTQSVPSLLSFLSPLSWRVWIYMLMAYVGVSVFLFIIARFSPYEWVSPHPCNQESDVLENQFSLMNSLWFTIGSLMQQGSDLAPTAWSTRMIAATWWFFTLIMISSYTANLAAFLTVQRMVSPIESAEDLSRQTKIKYGCYAGGSTENFFKNSKTYKRMWHFMESNYESVMVKASSEGVRRVMEGDYAYLMESTSIEYVTQRNCKITQIGGLLDSKGYGIATARNSPYRQLISSAILKLQEETVLDVMKVKWWKHKRGGGSCAEDDSGKGSTGTALTLANVGGVFVVLLGGIACSWFIGILEFVWKKRGSNSPKKASLCIEILKELKYALSCESSTRQVPKKEEFNDKADEDYKVPNSYPSMQFKEAIS